MPLNHEDQIEDSGFKIEWLIQKLEKTCPEYQKLSKESKVDKLNVKVISEGMGYMSVVYKCELVFENGEKLSYCLKVPCADKLSKIMDSESGGNELIKIHDRECQFYEDFKNVPNLKIPKVYSTQKLKSENSDKKEAHILMEFLGDQSATIELDASLTKEQLLNVVDQMASLHTYIRLNPDVYDPEKYAPFAGIEEEDEDGKKGDFDPEKMGENITNSLERLGDESFMEAIKKLDPVAKNNNFYKYVSTQSHLDVGLNPMLIHNDLWGNNILFKKDSNGLTNEIAGIIDWQIACAGNVTQDLVRLLVFNTSTELRRQLGNSILEAYYNKLGENLKKHNLEPDFSFQQLLDASKPVFVNQVFFSMFIVSFHFQQPGQENQRKHFMERVKQAALDAESLVIENSEKWCK